MIVNNQQLGCVVGNYIDLRINGQQDCRIARVENTQPEVAILLLYEVKGSHGAQTNKTEKVDITKHRVEAFRRYSGPGIPSCLRQGTIRLKVSVDEIQHVMGQLRRFPFEDMEPREIIQLIRGRHPFTVESLLTSDNNPAQIIKIYKEEYLQASLTFWVQYLSSLKFSHYHSEIALTVEKMPGYKKVLKGYKIELDCYASRQAAMESAFTECFQSLSSIVNMRSRGRLYSHSQECLQQLARKFSNWYVQSFISKLQLAISCIREDTLVPLKFVFHLVSFLSGIITYKDNTKNVSGPLVKQVLALYLNCLEKLEKLPVECIQCLFQDVTVPQLFEKFGDSEIEALSNTINLKLITFYTVLKEDFEKIQMKMKRVVLKPECLIKLAEIFQNFNILEYVLSQKNADMKLKEISQFSDILSKLCNMRSNLMEKSVATLFDSKSQHAIIILAQILIKAPSGIKSNIFSNIQSMEPGQKSQTIFSVSLKLGSSTLTNLYGPCAKLCLKHLNYCQEIQIRSLAQYLEKSSQLSLQILSHFITQLGSDNQTDQSWSLLTKLYEKVRIHFIEKDWQDLKQGFFKSLLKHKQSLQRARKRISAINTAITYSKPRQSDINALIQFYCITPVEQIRTLMANKFFFEGQYHTTLSNILTPPFLQSLYTKMLKLQMKQLTQSQLFMCLHFNIYASGGFIKEPSSEMERQGVRLLFNTMFQFEDSEALKKLITRITHTYLDISQPYLDSVLQDIVEMVIGSNTEQAYYFLGYYYERCEARCPAQRLRESNISAASQKTQKIDQSQTLNSKHLTALTNIIDKNYDKFYQNLPISWHIIQKRGFNKTPVGTLIDAATNQPQWSLLMNPQLQFKMRYYVIRYLQAHRTSAEQLIDRKAPLIFQKSLQFQHQYSQKIFYNSFIIDLLQVYYRHNKSTQQSFMNMFNLLLRVFHCSNYIARINRDATIKYIENIIELLLVLSDQTIKYMIEHEIFVQFIIDFVKIERDDITEHIVKKIITVVDTSSCWKMAIEQLLNYKSDAETQKQLLLFVSHYIDNSDAFDRDMAEQVLQVTCLFSMMDESVESERMNGILYILISILTRWGGFVKEIQMDIVNHVLSYIFISNLFEPAFKLLSIFCIVETTRLEIFRFLGTLLLRARWSAESIIDQVGNPQRRNYFIGLDNPRCICYMNSFLQQLYHIVPFSQMMLRTKWKKIGNDEQDIILQMKRLFLNLQKLTRDSYNNEPFYYDAFKNSDGKRIDISQQMDVDQFSKNLFDRLEKALQGQQNIVKQLFGGQIITTIACDECKQVSPRFQDSYSLHLDITSSCLQQAFEQFTKVEVMQNDNAYHCEKCSKKVRAQKKSKIHILPKIMLIVLNRFYYHRESGKEKLHKVFEFPMDSFKTSKNLCQSQEGTYKLRGTVVHRGSGQAGHYYSYIKIENNWYLFNDNEVTRASKEEVQASSYGQPKQLESGYLLIYERQDVDWRNFNRKHQELYQYPQDMKLINSEIEQDQLKVLFFSQQMGQFVENSLEYDSSDILSLQFYWLYFYQVKIYSCQSFQKLSNYLLNKPTNIIKRFLSVSHINNVLNLQVDKCIELKHMYCHLLARSINQLDDETLNNTINMLILMTYNNTQSNFIYLLLAKMTKFKPEITKMLIDKKMVGRIFDVFYSDFGDNKDSNMEGFKKSMRDMSDINYHGKIDMVKHDYNRSLPRYRWVLLRILLQSGHPIPPEQQNVMQQKNIKIIKKIIDEATVKININRISWFLCQMAKNTAFLDNMVYVIETILKNPRIQNLRSCFKIIKDLCKMHNKNRYHVKIDTLLKTMINIMRENCYCYAQQKSQSVEQYRNEPKLFYQLTFQWLIKIMDRVECFRDRVEHFIRNGQMHFVDNFIFKPYKNTKVYLRNNQVNDYTRNYYHNLEILNNQKQHETLYKVFRHTYLSIKAGKKYTVVPEQHDSDDDMFMSDVKEKDRVRLVHKLSNVMVKEEVEVVRVVGDYMALKNRNSVVYTEYTYDENVYLMTDQDESFQ